MKTFKHSGDLGDIIFSLPTVRALGGGLLYLDPCGGEKDPFVHPPHKNKTNLNEATISSLQHLLLEQDYIEDVRCWRGESVDYNLDKFRQHVKYNNLAKSHLSAFELNRELANDKWLNCEKVSPEKKVVVSRSLKVHGNHSFWEEFFYQYRNDSVFVGTEFECEVFNKTFGFNIPYQYTETILDLAKVINGAEVFMGNQSLPHSIAEGLKKSPMYHEVYRVYPAVVFEREGLTNV